MKEIKKGSAGALFIFMAMALGFYASKNGGEDPEVAEEEALTHYNGGSYSMDDEMEEAEDIGAFQSMSNTAMEVPVGGISHGIHVAHEGFQLSYDTLNHNPFWVAWELTKGESDGRTSRGEEFKEDPQIPAHHAVRYSAYSNTGYTRGHMCPAGDQKWSRKAMDDCFYMSNMCPQTAELNRYWWDWLERAERQWAAEEGRVYIVCGPIYDGQVSSLEKNGQVKFFVGIPDRFFKVILSTRKGHEKAIGFIYRNDDSQQYLEDCVYDVDEIERITGYDFFSPLADPLENRIEASSDLSDWGNVPMPSWE